MTPILTIWQNVRYCTIAKVENYIETDLFQCSERDKCILLYVIHFDGVWLRS
jgi:hypothetical protein